MKLLYYLYNCLAPEHELKFQAPVPPFKIFGFGSGSTALVGNNCFWI